jgi:hypothetical protein
MSPISRLAVGLWTTACKFIKISEELHAVLKLLLPLAV